MESILLSLPALFLAFCFLIWWLRVYWTNRERSKDRQQRYYLVGDQPLDQRRQRWAALTLRERAVAQLAIQGLSNDEIAAELCISRRTVEKHLENIYRKLDIRSRGALQSLRPHLGDRLPDDTT